MGFLPFEGTLSIVISPKKVLSKERKRPIDWHDYELELSEEELEESPPSINQEALVEEHFIGTYPISGLLALDLEKLELSSQYGEDTLEECQHVVHTIVAACFSQVGDYLPTRDDSNSPLVAISPGIQLLKATTYPTRHKHPQRRMDATGSAAAVRAAAARAVQLSITLRASQEADKPISLVLYSKFHGELGSDPNKHISEFLLQCIANNVRTNIHWHSIFSTTLEGHAKLWFYRQPLGSFPNWDTLRIAFVAHFCPIGY